MRVRTIAIATLAACLALTLTACGAGNNAATSLIKNVTDGAEGSITVDGNDIKVNNHH